MVPHLLSKPNSHRREGLTLPPIFAEILGRQPSFERHAQGRPFAIRDGEPGGVSISSLIDHRLPESAFISKAITLGGAARRLVEAVAFPFISAVTQLVENAAAP